MKLLSRVRLLATPWTAAYQAPPSMGFSRQEYWSGVPLPLFWPDILFILKFYYLTSIIYSYCPFWLLPFLTCFRNHQMDSVTPGSPCFLNPLKAESLCPTFYHSPLACDGQVWRFGDNAIYALKTDTRKPSLGKWLQFKACIYCNDLVFAFYCHILQLPREITFLLFSYFRS